MLADELETCDREQQDISIRCVSEMYEINDDAIGQVQLDTIRAETIYTAIKDALLLLGMQFENCRGQDYDGAKTFQGTLLVLGKDFKRSFHVLYQYIVHVLYQCNVHVLY